VATTEEDHTGEAPAERQLLTVLAAVAVTAPALAVRFSDPGLPQPVAALLYGLAIVGAAFLLSWAAEAAQLDISAGMAISVLAFITVLPEYAVDLVFAIRGGRGFARYGAACAAPGSHDASPCSLALANMTGANRLLIGIGWSLVVLIAYRGWRRQGVHRPGVVLERSHSVELAFLALACAFSLLLPLARTVNLVHAAVLIAIFGAYTIRISRAPAQKPDLVGPARWVGSFPSGRRRATVAALFVGAAGIIVLCAEHFATALVGSGRSLGVDEFLLVQWLAPLASEAPELLVAGLYAWRLNTNAGLGTLVSSKVNQWTLLVGTLPIAFALASGTGHGLPIAAGQREELFLTAAQSVYAVVTLANLSISLREAGTLFGLFWAQFLTGALVPEEWRGRELVAFGILYLGLAAVGIWRDRAGLPRLMVDGFRTSYADMAEDDR